jgi:hypothetical protein
MWDEIRTYGALFCVVDKAADAGNSDFEGSSGLFHLHIPSEGRGRLEGRGEVEGLDEEYVWHQA